MKRWLIWCIVLLLVLSGCTTGTNEETKQQTNPSVQEPTEPANCLYVAGSEIEKKTNGMVLVYSPEKSTVAGVGFMGEDTVMISTDSAETVVTRFDTQSGNEKASVTLPVVIDPQDGSVAMTENKFVYYDAQSHCLRILNGELQETDQVKMPEGVQGAPLLSADLTEAFYSAGSEIRSLSLQTGIPRLVLQLSSQTIRLDGFLFDEMVLACLVTEEDGEQYEEFFSAQTGESLGKDGSLIGIESWDESYLVRRKDWCTTEVLVGDRNGRLQQFFVPDTSDALFVLPASKNVATLSQTDGGDVLTVYELTNGNRVSSMTLGNAVSVHMPAENPDGQYLWFVARDPKNGQDILCRWDFVSTGGGDSVARIGQRYTRQNPDQDGLAQCEQMAKELEKKYNVEIKLAAEPVAPEGYRFEHEYQAPAFRQALEELDAAMAKYPSGFFKKVASVYNNRKLHISLVRGIATTSYTGQDTSEGLQYWVDGSGYIALVVGDNVEGKFHRELSLAMDTYVYSHSIHYDFWKDCNPEGFSYDESYMLYKSHSDSPYLKDKTRAFIDAYSMTYAHEDRAKVLEYAMMDGNEAYFATDIMQAKLKQLCLGIRQAFGWKKYEGTFIWEQYLNESLAYVAE